VPVYGDLRTVSLIDLLRWASQNQKTGVLEVERNAICRRVEFRKGWVGSCSSNDPSARLGQSLLARGYLNETQLQHLLTLQRFSHKRLGLLIVEMNIISRSELTAVVASRARETVHSLFDWEDAFFRFDDGASLDPDQIEVNLSVEDLLAEGVKRGEILKRIRNAFVSSGVVLSRTDVPPPEEIVESEMARRVFESIDADQTIAEILLHARGSEFSVLTLLHRLFELGMVSVKEIREIGSERTTLLDISDRNTLRSFDQPIASAEVERALNQIVPAVATERGDLDVTVRTATALMEQQEFEAAVELLRAGCREFATDYLRRLLAQAERALLKSVQENEAFVSSTPVLQHDRRLSVGTDLAPEQTFLLSLVDGETDVRSILWLSPLRDVDVLIELRRLARKNLIELVESENLNPGADIPS